jgi:hypothetical protein
MWFVNRSSEVAYSEKEEMVAVLAAPPLMTLFSSASARWCFGGQRFFFLFLRQDDPEALYQEGSSP